MSHFLWPSTSQCLQPRSSSDSQPSEALDTEANIQLFPLGSTDQDAPFTEVHDQLAPAHLEKREDEEMMEDQRERGAEEASGVEVDSSAISEGVSQEYALSSTLCHEEKGEEEGAQEKKEEDGP